MEDKLDYAEIHCRYCKEKKLLATLCNEYSNGLVVVHYFCDNCGKTQKFSNNPKRLIKSKREV